jgi:DNA-binding HxlR family transcriptional regulator
MRDLMFTDRRTYTDFLGADESIATNILATRLRQLQAQGLIRRRGTGRGATYGLTKKGLDLLPAMLELISWSARYDPRTAAPPDFVARIRRDREAVATDLRTHLRRRHGLDSRSRSQEP